MVTVSSLTFNRLVIVSRHGGLEVIIDLTLVDPGIAHCRRDAAHARIGSAGEGRGPPYAFLAGL